jgi:hypothetical protein
LATPPVRPSQPAGASSRLDRSLTAIFASSKCHQKIEPGMGLQRARTDDFRVQLVSYLQA